jgi:YCII-related domain
VRGELLDTGEKVRQRSARRPVVRPRLCRSSRSRRRAAGTLVRERTLDMAKFIYLYRGPAPDLTPEQAAERMAAFAAWLEEVGTALVDGGSPFGASVSVRDDGTEGAAGGLIGYTIVEAADLAAAKAMTDGLPFLSGSNGECAVEIFELLTM